jgi:hypothetical protein
VFSNKLPKTEKSHENSKVRIQGKKTVSNILRSSRIMHLNRQNCGTYKNPLTLQSLRFSIFIQTLLSASELQLHKKDLASLNSTLTESAT